MIVGFKIGAWHFNLIDYYRDKYTISLGILNIINYKILDFDLFHVLIGAYDGVKLRQDHKMSFKGFSILSFRHNKYDIMALIAIYPGWYRSMHYYFSAKLRNLVSIFFIPLVYIWDSYYFLRKD
jgi:hypothetical protein